MFRLCFALALALAVSAVVEETLPARGGQISTIGTVTVPSNYLGASYASKLHLSPLTEGTAWNADTMYWSGTTGSSVGVLLDYGDMTCDITQFKLQADDNDDFWIDYFANGVWTPVHMGYCFPSPWSYQNGPAACTSVGDGVRTRTLSVTGVTGVSKLRVYASNGDGLASVSRLYAQGNCRPGGLLPAHAASVSVTGFPTVPSGYLVAPPSSKLFSTLLAEGTNWQADTIWWNGSGVSTAVHVDLIGQCNINRLILQADDNDQMNVDYYANDAWTSIPFGYCNGAAGARPGICATNGPGVRTITLPVTITGASRLRTYCTTGDNQCSVGRLFAFGTCFTPDPAVNAYCTVFNGKCAEIEGHCTDLQTQSAGGNPLVAATASDCDATAAACHGVYDDCLTKAGACPLV